MDQYVEQTQTPTMQDSNDESTRWGAPIRTISPAQAFPYNPSTLETLYFSIPLELRQQIYTYVFHTPPVVFQKTLKGWRDTPQLDEVEKTLYHQNGTQLLAINRRIRNEALPVLYRTATWHLKGFEMLREWLNNATIANLSHLHVRRVSLVQWPEILQHWNARRRGESAEQGSFIASLLSGLPSLREAEISPQLLPEKAKDYEAEEWISLMETLRGNGGVLKITGAACEMGDWFFDWRIVGGKNFGLCERVLLKTSVEVRDWNELVEGDWSNFDFGPIFLDAMTQNWARGPLKHAVVRHAATGREFRCKFWGVPENVRKSEERKEANRMAKKALMERQAKEAPKKGKGRESPKLEDLGGWEAEDDGQDEDGVDDVNVVRTRKVVTREEARGKRMEKQRGGR
jgi:hypothetical protein